MPAVIYRWFDFLGNENTQFSDTFDYVVHEQIVSNIIDHRNKFNMSPSELRLVVTIVDKDWVSYNLLKHRDNVVTWRTHKN
jgi:type II secretory pathway component PulL